jgi:hypothetical protein
LDAGGVTTIGLGGLLLGGDDGEDGEDGDAGLLGDADSSDDPLPEPATSAARSAAASIT